MGKQNKDTITKDNNLWSKFIKWLYSGNHPQQKYYKGLQQATDDREKILEAERYQREQITKAERHQRQEKTE